MNAQNTNATVTAIIPRYAPLSDKAMIFYPSTRGDGQIDCVVDGKRMRVGIDVYMATERLTEEDSKKIALEYAKQENIDPALLIVRQRLPKQMKGKEQPQHNRRTNDANLKLVETDKKDGKQTLAKAAQDLQNAHNQEKKQANRKDDRKSTPENPEGAVVQPRAKRAYRKKSDKEVSARSAAALRRYHQELEKTASQSPTLMEGVASNVSQEVQDAAIMELATAIAKILKSNKGVL